VIISPGHYTVQHIRVVEAR